MGVTSVGLVGQGTVLCSANCAASNEVEAEGEAKVLGEIGYGVQAKSKKQDN
jgi:hypothetical protein